MKDLFLEIMANIIINKVKNNPDLQGQLGCPLNVDDKELENGRKLSETKQDIS